MPHFAAAAAHACHVVKALAKHRSSQLQPLAAVRNLNIQRERGTVTSSYSNLALVGRALGACSSSCARKGRQEAKGTPPHARCTSLYCKSHRYPSRISPKQVRIHLKPQTSFAVIHVSTPDHDASCGFQRTIALNLHKENPFETATQR
jgi:hypothetical protein